MKYSLFLARQTAIYLILIVTVLCLAIMFDKGVISWSDPSTRGAIYGAVLIAPICAFFDLRKKFAK